MREVHQKTDSPTPVGLMQVIDFVRKTRVFPRMTGPSIYYNYVFIKKRRKIQRTKPTIKKIYTQVGRRNSASHQVRFAPMPVTSAGTTAGSLPSIFEIKSSQLSCVALVLKTGELAQVCSALLNAYGPDGENAAFFENDPVVLDFSYLPTDAHAQPLAGLLAALRDCRLIAVAARGAAGPWEEACRTQGLPVVAEEPVRQPKATKQLPVEETVEVVREVIKQVPGPATMVVDKPIRSGQKIYARGGDLVILAMVNQGAEVVADGNIHVYAPLRGKAMAGARGNTGARIFSLCLEPELISIAGVYRTSETPLPKSVHGKPAQVLLSTDGQERLLIEPLS
jgi:septum site-determining protein MinC